ncbi:AbrB/MazE/SpoVT family DNA-binding domain-containing protein [Candidatus Peregrinibacteria bacterium]|nr:AbrB/MazE/SpoVT family DNA-binding domain-containing protein [Candidatus Peregrinibacteria bacterium]
MRTMIHKWGNSLAVRIPKAFAVSMGIESGKEVELSMDAHGLRIFSPSQVLETLLLEVTTENIHSETATGTPQGNEIW